MYDVGRHGDSDYLVMECLAGETLAGAVAARGPLPIDEALAIALQVLGALDAAHARGIVHRDLKPGNIFLVRAGATAARPRVKVLDFGLAKAFGAPGAEAPGLHEEQTPGLHQAESATVLAPMTEAGLTVGTAAYMSPEPAEGQPANARILARLSPTGGSGAAAWATTSWSRSGGSACASSTGGPGASLPSRRPSSTCQPCVDDVCKPSPDSEH